MEIKSGIYKIENLINGKIYVGQTQDFHIRWREHKRALNKGTHSNGRLNNAWAKYGEDSFSFSVLEYVKDVSLLNECEQFWIDLLDTHTNGYNISPTAGCTRGMKHSLKTKALWSSMRRGQPSPTKGKKASLETRAKISAAGRRRKATEETRAKLAALKDPVYIEFNGECKTIREWANVLGINRHTIRHRIFYLGWSVEKAFTTKVLVSETFEFRGKEQTLGEWAHEYNLPEDLVVQRFRRHGWTLERALSTPISRIPKKRGLDHPNAKPILFNGEAHCAAEWCRIVGISQLTFIDRLKSGWSVEKALTTPVKKRKRDKEI